MNEKIMFLSKIKIHYTSSYIILDKSLFPIFLIIIYIRVLIILKLILHKTIMNLNKKVHILIEMVVFN